MTTEGLEASLKALAASSRVFANLCCPTSNKSEETLSVVAGSRGTPTGAVPVEETSTITGEEVEEEDPVTAGSVEERKSCTEGEEEEAGAEKFAKNPATEDSTLYATSIVLDNFAEGRKKTDVMTEDTSCLL